MKTKKRVIPNNLIITIRAGFAQKVQEKIEYPNLVKNGDFEDGNVGFKSDFKYADTYSNWGSYVITDNAAVSGGRSFCKAGSKYGEVLFHRYGLLRKTKTVV